MFIEDWKYKFPIPADQVGEIMAWLNLQFGIRDFLENTKWRWNFLTDDQLEWHAVMDESKDAALYKLTWL